MIKCLIIAYNRLTLIKNTALWCSDHGLEPIIIDNHSDYPPLLEYYKNCPYQVERMPRNFGHKVIWDALLLDVLGITSQYIVTDPDLDFSGIPDDFLEVLQEGLKRYPKAEKCGFSLDVNDLREGDIKKWEISLWSRPLDDMYFVAGIDTTFALYRGNSRQYQIWNSLRTNRPYTARHIPWTYTDLALLTEDEQYYFKSCSKSASGKEWLFKK